MELETRQIEVIGRMGIERAVSQVPRLVEKLDRAAYEVLVANPDNLHIVKGSVGIMSHNGLRSGVWTPRVQCSKLSRCCRQSLYRNLLNERQVINLDTYRGLHEEVPCEAEYPEHCVFSTRYDPNVKEHNPEFAPHLAVNDIPDIPVSAR